MKKFSSKRVSEANESREEKRKQGGGSRRPNYISESSPLELFNLEEAGLIYLDIMPIKVNPGNPLYEEGVEYDYSRRFEASKGFKPEESERHLSLPKSFAQRFRCPLSNYAWDTYKDETDLDGIGWDEGKKLLPKKRQWFIVRDPSWDEGVFKLWDISYFLFGDKLEEKLDALDPQDPDDAGKEAFFSPSEGFTLKLNVKEKVFGKGKYYEVTSVDFKPRAEQYDDSIADELPNVEQIFVKPTKAELEAVLREHRIEIGAIDAPQERETEESAPEPEAVTVTDGEAPFDTDDDSEWDNFG